MTTYRPVCFECKHYFRDYKCKVFPDNIPLDIVEGDFDHTKKHPEQENDIVFEKK